MPVSGGFGPSHRDLRSASQPNRITTCRTHSISFKSGS
jgi:hypothetical protein